MHVWRSVDNFVELVPSFLLVGSRDQTQVVRLGGKVPLPAKPSCCPKEIYP